MNIKRNQYELQNKVGLRVMQYLMNIKHVA